MTVLTAVGLFARASADAPAQARSDVPAAVVGDETISMQEVQEPIQDHLAQLDQRRYALLRQRLDRLIGDRLVAQEAKKVGISVERLLKTEVYGKTPEVTEEEVTTFMAQNRERLPSGGDTEIRLRVWDHLRSQKAAEWMEAYVSGLRARSKVSIYLEEPAGTRFSVDKDRGFARGSKKAPVTVTEFSDFQCPFCKNASATMAKVLKEYDGKVKWVFRDFPIQALHPAAPKAHEAARCAAEHGKFWEYHDVLFERAPRHAPDELKRYADELRIDRARFSECLDSGKYQTEISREIQEGLRLGVSGTPTFFVNGRPLVGSQPLSAFETLIEIELASVTPQ